MPDPLYATLASPVVLGALGLVGLIGAMYAIHRLRLIALARRPGPILIAELRDASGAAGARAGELTMRLRGRLTAINLHAPAPQPGGAKPVSFIDHMHAAGARPDNLFATLVGLLRALPTHAYSVEGILLLRDQGPRYGVSLRVALEPNGVSPPVSVWARSWEAAIDDAATAVAALILPATRKCRRAPWAAWEGRAMPPRLLGEYLLGRSCHEQRRYDEALGAYYRALEIDPLNVELRLEIAGLQEQLALWLDALNTYHEIISLTSGLLWRDLGRGPIKNGLGGFHVRRAERRARFLARYRCVILMGVGSGLADEWCKLPASCGFDGGQPEPSERARELDRARQRAASFLAARRKRAPDYTERRKTWENVAARVPDDRLELCENFQREAKAVAKQLLKASRHTIMRFRGSGLTRYSLGLLDPWTDRHIAHTRALRDGTESLRDFDELSNRLRSERRKYLLGMLLSAAGRYSDHYNAACVYSVALLTPTAERVQADNVKRKAPVQVPDDEERKKRERFADAAVKQLREAVVSAHSDAIARRREWVVNEDPDLAGLRREQAFILFVDAYMPSSRHSSIERPPNAHRLELFRHTAQVMRRCARALEEEWHDRGAECDRVPDVHVLQQWMRQEERAWSFALRLAQQHEHWPTRLDVVAEMNRWTEAVDRPAVVLPFPDLAEKPLPRGDSDKAATAAVEDFVRQSAARLCKLREGLSLPALHADTRRWDEFLRASDTDGRLLSLGSLRELCRARAALWRTLNDWFDDDAATGMPKDEFEQFCVAVDRLAEPRQEPLARHYVSIATTLRSFCINIADAAGRRGDGAF